VKLSVSLENYFYTLAKGVNSSGKGAEAMARLVLDWISLFLDQTTPEELLVVLRITDQKALYDKLAEMFAPHLAKHLETLPADQKGRDQAEIIGKLVMQFLTQGFCEYIDDGLYISLGTPYPQKVAVMLHQKLQPHLDSLEVEARLKLKDSQDQILKDRSQQYQSPDISKESRPDICAAEKLQVLRNSLIAINNIGAFDDKNQLHHQVVEYNNRTFDAANQFFQANPDFTVAHLLTVLGKCLELPKERDYREEGNDSLWHARKGRDISFLLQHLDIIVQSLNCVDEIGPFQPLPPGTLFKKSSKVTEKEHD